MRLEGEINVRVGETVDQVAFDSECVLDPRQGGRGVCALHVDDAATNNELRQMAEVVWATAIRRQNRQGSIETDFSIEMGKQVRQRTIERAGHGPEIDQPIGC